MMITRDLVWTQVEQAFSRISKLMEVCGCMHAVGIVHMHWQARNILKTHVNSVSMYNYPIVPFSVLYYADK